MGELLVAPSALLVAVTVLRDGLRSRDEQGVFTRVPKTRPSRFVTVSRAGGSQPNVVTDSVVLIVQAWDDDPQMGEFRSEQTANLCAGLLRAASGTRVAGAKIRRWEPVSVPAWFPDDSGIPRFQFTGELRLRLTKQ